MTLILAALLTLLQPGQPADVTGTIVDSSGSTIPGATVQLEAAGIPIAQMQTGSDGRFSFPPGPGDELRLLVTAPGFAFQAVQVPGDSAAPITITMEPAPFFDAVQVTSARGSGARADPTVAATVLPASEVITSPAVAIDDVLKIVPGFTLFPSSRVANPTSQTMMLRGLGGSGVTRSLVLADGVPLNDAFGGWVYWDKVPHTAIDRIEVVRGVGGDLYGADAVGGVVQILTLEPGGPFARVLAEAGNLETGRVSAFGGGRAGPWTLSGGAQWFTTSGYTLIGEDERGAVDRPSGSKHGSGIGSLSYASPTGWRFGVRGNVFAEDRTNGTPLQVNDTDSRRISGEVLGALAGGFLAVRVSGGNQNYNQTFSEIEMEPPRSAEALSAVQHVPSRSAGGSVQWSRQWGDKGLLIGGEGRSISGRTSETDYRDGGVAGTIEEGGSVRIGSGYVRASMAVTDRFTMVAGGHADAWRSLSRTTSFEQTVGAFSPRFSAAYRFGDSGVAIRGSVFGGFRPPTLNELYRTFQIGNDLTVPNQALTPETLKSAETGMSLTRGAASIRVTGFLSVLDDAVTNVTISTTPSLNVRRRENADRIRSMGIEFEGDLRVSQTLTMAVAGALIDARFKGRTPLRDFQVPQVPQYSGSGVVRYRDSVWIASGLLRVTGPQYDDDVNTRLLERAVVVDVFGGRNFNRRTMGFVAVENLFDARYDVGRIPVRVEGLPRAVRAGIQVVFP
jgi:iron complex outermembrane receptor protein